MAGTIVHSLRPAQRDDAEKVVELIEPYVASGLVLPRTPDEIRGHLQDFLIAESADGGMIGCVALRDYGMGLVEIRSLAVYPSYNNHGVGTHLVAAAVALARERGASRVFALTMRPHIFCRLGFATVAKDLWLQEFPQKVWNDCQICRKKEQCDEVAVLLPIQP